MVSFRGAGSTTITTRQRSRVSDSGRLAGLSAGSRCAHALDLNKAASYEFSFDLGYPFKPFEQLMGVLPQLSSAHIPRAFRDLMSDTTSPIIDFYPVDFLLDMNGKKQEWEAIVKIPFIDEKRLLKTMAAREVRLTDEERSRNTFGDSWRFTYDESRERVYPSSLPGFFPDILQCRTVVEPFHLPTLAGGLSFVKGLVPGVLLGADAISGFPSMHTIPFTGQLGFHGVSIFQQDSKKETMVITIDNQFDGLVSESVAQLLVGKRMFVGYPYLKEAHVTAVSDELFRYEVQQMSPGNYRVFSTPHSGPAVMEWKRSADKLEHTASKKQGVMIGHVEMLVHAQLIKGTSSSSFAVDLALTYLRRRAQASRRWFDRQGIRGRRARICPADRRDAYFERGCSLYGE